MDSIDFEGQKYISSKTASRLTGYAQDYVGQLARSKKIPATRVGRGWYVSESDILKHAGKEVIIESQELPKHTSQSNFVKGEVVEPKLEIDRNTDQKQYISLRSLQSRDSRDTFKTWGSVQYFSEDDSLLPEVKNKASHNIDHNLDNETIAIPLRRIKVQNKSALKETKSFNMSNSQDQKNNLISSEKDNQDNLRLSWILVPATIAISLFALSSFLGALSVSSEWVISTNSQVSTAYQADFSALIATFSIIYNEGINILTAFLKILYSSMSEFFVLGLDFIQNLFR